MTSVAFLWHLHQPDYRHPETGIPVMPWARLHALRGYRDMALEAIEQRLPWTLNIVPVLLDQLEHYAHGGSDRHLDLTRRAAGDLDSDEVREVCSTFAGGHPAMSDAHPRWRALRQRIEAGDAVSGQDLRDVQVWSTLAWFGATARRDHPALESLIQRGGDFSEADKAQMLRVHDAVVGELPGLFRHIAGVGSVSTSPYYHPILPLVCGPGVNRPEDALRQLTSARARFEDAFGAAPVGLWPSEGAVSTHAVQLAAEAGFRWLCTDEGILHRSDADGPKHRSGPWDLGHGMQGWFRNRDLSDRIGFHYATRPVEDAVGDFVRALDQHEGPVLVALDGENPWESYPQAGAPFRRRLVEVLGDRLVSLETPRPSIGRVHRLHTGSWINANLDIWFGHRDDRHAWALVSEAREAAANHPDAEQAEAAIQRLLPAEGSDWTWWYGEEFETPFAAAFDGLFRAHLRAAWRALGIEPPTHLDTPIATASAAHQEPTSAVSPRLSAPDPADWLGAGHLRVKQGVMAAAVAAIEIRYGWSDDGALWVWFRASGPVDVWQVELPAHAEARTFGGDAVVRVPQGRGSLVAVARGPAGELRSARLDLSDPGGSSPLV